MIGLGEEGSTGLAARRVLGRAAGTEAPRLVCVGGLHGNEPEGRDALVNVARSLAEEPPALSGGWLFLAGNQGALALEERHLGSDLNRGWVGAVPSLAAPDRAGDDSPTAMERRALAAEFVPAFGGGAKPVLLDLHTTSGPGAPFIIPPGAGPREPMGTLCERLRLPLVNGLARRVDGALMSWWDAGGAPALVVEGGQAGTTQAVQVLEAVVWQTLVVVLGLDPADPRAVAADRLLRRVSLDLPDVVDVLHVHPVVAGDGFRMARPGGIAMHGFQRVSAGQVLATDANGPIHATADGFLLMPLYQGRGEEGFFLVGELQE